MLASAGVWRTVKAIENRRHLLGRYAHAGVAHHAIDMSVALLQRNGDFALEIEFEGVRQVGSEVGKISGFIVDLTAPRFKTRKVEKRIDQFEQAQRVAMDAVLLRADNRQIEGVTTENFGDSRAANAVVASSGTRFVAAG
jgi:hypothetical protein